MHITSFDLLMFVGLALLLGFFAGRWARSEAEYLLESQVSDLKRHVESLKSWIDSERQQLSSKPRNRLTDSHRQQNGTP